MKKAELQQRVLNGARLFVVEYRSSNPDHIKWRDKETGKSQEMSILSHNVEMGADTIRVGERVPDTFDIVGFKPPFPKGTACVLHLDAFSREKGVFKASGRLEALTD